MWHITRVAGFGTLLMLLAVVTSEEGWAQKKDKKAESSTPAATPADYIQLQNRKEISGTIVNVGMGGKSVTLRVEFPHLEPNPNYKAPKDAAKNPQANQQYQQLRRYQDLMRQQEQAMRAKTPQEQQRALQRIQIEMARFQQQQQKEYQQLMAKSYKDQKNTGKGNSNNEPFHVVTTTKDYELDVQDAAPIRKTFLPFEYDDTGSPRVYSEKEKAELRGTDKTKPGYKAKIDEAGAGVEAKLHLTPPKSKKKAAKDDEEGVGNVDRPTVNMIVLTKENPMPLVGDTKKKKDKK
jgi:hypothetical protein